ncbi:hypothetical protein QAD02_019164 [Eretmocerus hayati]|uniref:Uncharacterized protein n=1 Tax=Eretmocerus hayati TaxID=131215 RepID=A0ACC2PIT8_9HYME|nr:hypothetical protein QAD02_019164 [Eretmocerus hayati]
MKKSSIAMIVLAVVIYVSAAYAAQSATPAASANGIADDPKRPRGNISQEIRQHLLGLALNNDTAGLAQLDLVSKPNFCNSLKGQLPYNVADMKKYLANPPGLQLSEAEKKQISNLGSECTFKGIMTDDCYYKQCLLKSVVTMFHKVFYEKLVKEQQEAQSQNKTVNSNV